MPALWLRERCQDAGQVDALTRQRLFNPHELAEELALTKIEPDGTGQAWLSFSDGCRGRYDLGALAEEVDISDRLPPPLPWRSDLDRELVTHDWPALARDDRLHAALSTFLERGFLILRQVPVDRERVLAVAEAFGHLRDTNFGRYFEVYSRPHGNDLAYSSVALGPHTDNPYREPVPGIQLLHCLANETSGGLSTLADSLAVGAVLKDEDPEGFECLAATPVCFRFRDAEEEFVEWRPVIRRDAHGRMTGLHYSPRLDFLPLMDEASLKRYHRLRRKLARMLSDPRFELRFPLAAGELLMFDNARVVHGRTEFDPREGRRHLQGCYIDVDEPRSRFRVLSRRRQSHGAPEAR